MVAEGGPRYRLAEFEGREESGDSGRVVGVGALGRPDAERDDSPGRRRHEKHARAHGDPLALELIDDTARYIGIGTVNVLHTLNPEMVLLGGAMTFGRSASPVGRRLLEQVRATVREWALPIPGSRTQIDFATLGNDAGFIGAAGCALRAHEAATR